MPKINHLTVTVTYTVGIGDVEVSEEVLKQLNKAVDMGGEIDGDSNEMSEAIDFLTATINESDAMEWKYSIDDIS
jgi:hypothetical protein